MSRRQSLCSAATTAPIHSSSSPSSCILSERPVCRSYVDPALLQFSVVSLSLLHPHQLIKCCCCGLWFKCYTYGKTRAQTATDRRRRTFIHPHTQRTTIFAKFAAAIAASSDYPHYYTVPKINTSIAYFAHAAAYRLSLYSSSVAHPFDSISLKPPHCPCSPIRPS